MATYSPSYKDLSKADPIATTEPGTEVPAPRLEVHVSLDAALKAVGQVQMRFLTQAPPRADTKAVADEQHSDHQRRVNRWTSGVAVELCQMLPQTH